ncbi:TniB family NTP-binding protein [Aliiroseovarius sp. M344]|uniref:TniB family NTP-binding protein n=1 Tax=Aliiroseovarius sp. M344 TaxID=2867010 RepID=UPI0021ADCE1B|nr:TniB family NTP-binding protein [Aliiroseovarius sp. M344]UWQ14143.1 TniB family NTP-binding protein [Aliiroseovarius sp. M344]
MTKHTRLSPEIHVKLAKLRGRFMPRKCFVDMSDAICNLEDRRRAEISQGLHPEARGLAVIGNSGSGKSTGVAHFFRKSETLSLLADGNDTADVASFLVPSPATLKGVGISCLSGLGYPLMRDRTAGIIWELVQSHLRELKVIFLHLDEAQDLMGSQSEREMLAVVNTLKSVMQNRHWPVSIILSGLPDLLTLLNLDPQLGRRFTPIQFDQLDEIDDGRQIRSLLEQYCSAISIDLEPELRSDDFIARLIHSAASEFGILIEIVIGAIEICLRREETTLGKHHFVAEFLRRTGCANDLNPFVRKNYSAINPRRLLPSSKDVSPDVVPPRKPRKKK